MRSNSLFSKNENPSGQEAHSSGHMAAYDLDRSHDNLLTDVPEMMEIDEGNMEFQDEQVVLNANYIALLPADVIKKIITELYLPYFLPNAELYIESDINDQLHIFEITRSGVVMLGKTYYKHFQFMRIKQKVTDIFNNINDVAGVDAAFERIRHLLNSVASCEMKQKLLSTHFDIPDRDLSMAVPYGMQDENEDDGVESELEDVIINSTRSLHQLLVNTAIAFRDSNVMQVLLNSGIDPNLLDNNGYSPLQNAVLNYGDVIFYERDNYMKESLIIVELLIAKGANVNVRDGSGRSLLHLLFQPTYCGRYEIALLQLLIKHNIEFKCVDGNFDTPLSICILSNSFEVVNYLIENGLIYFDNNGLRRIQEVLFNFDYFSASPFVGNGDIHVRMYIIEQLMIHIPHILINDHNNEIRESFLSSIKLLKEKVAASGDPECEKSIAQLNNTVSCICARSYLASLYRSQSIYNMSRNQLVNIIGYCMENASIMLCHDVKLMLFDKGLIKKRKIDSILLLILQSKGDASVKQRVCYQVGKMLFNKYSAETDHVGENYYYLALSVFFLCAAGDEYFYRPQVSQVFQVLLSGNVFDSSLTIIDLFSKYRDKLITCKNNLQATYLSIPHTSGDDDIYRDIFNFLNNVIINALEEQDLNQTPLKDTNHHEDDPLSGIFSPEKIADRVCVSKKRINLLSMFNESDVQEMSGGDDVDKTPTKKQREDIVDPPSTPIDKSSGRSLYF